MRQSEEANANARRAKERADKLRDDFNAAEKEAVGSDANAKALTMQAEQMVCYADEIAAKECGLATVEKRRDEHNARVNVAAALQRAKAQVDEHAKKHAALETGIEKIRALKVGIGKAVEIVPGLAIADGGLTFEGLPLNQAATSRRLRVACALAFAEKPQLKLLRVDDGEHLDSKSRAELISIANEHGWQVVMTTVADIDGLKVEIVEAAS